MPIKRSAPAMAKNKLINLLPQEEFEGTTLGRVLRWAMGTFRIIVIVTEMVVMGAFLSRFWLDAKNSTLSESIKIASSQIQVQSAFEIKFRNLQNKISIFKQIAASQKSSERLGVVAGKTPTGVNITSVSVKDNEATVKGDSVGETEIAQFISNLKSDTSIKRVALGSLSSTEGNQSFISFELNVIY